MLLLFLISSGLVGRLGILGGSGRGSGGGIFSSRFVPTIHHSVGLDFMGGVVSELTFSGDQEISLSYIGSWL